MKHLLSFAGIVSLAAIVAAVILNAVFRAVPGLVVILPFYVFWTAQKMTWESEFAYAANRLLKEGRQ